MLDDVFHFLRELGVVDWLGDVQGTAIQRVMVPCVQHVLLDGLKTLYGVERMNALPALLCSDEALMRLVGCNAHQVRQGVCQRGAVTRQGPRQEGPIGPDTWAENIVKLNLRDLAALFNGVIRALNRSTQGSEFVLVFHHRGSPWGRLPSGGHHAGNPNGNPDALFWSTLVAP